MTFSFCCNTLFTFVANVYELLPTKICLKLQSLNGHLNNGSFANAPSGFPSCIDLGGCLEQWQQSSRQEERCQAVDFKSFSHGLRAELFQRYILGQNPSVVDQQVEALVLANNAANLWGKNQLQQQLISVDLIKLPIQGINRLLEPSWTKMVNQKNVILKWLLKLNYESTPKSFRSEHWIFEVKLCITFSAKESNSSKFLTSKVRTWTRGLCPAMSVNSLAWSLKRKT